MAARPPPVLFHSIGGLQKNGFGTVLPIKSDGLMNVYYGVAPRITRRGQGKDVTVVGAIWFDEFTRLAPTLLPLSFMVETSPGKVQGGYLLDHYTDDLKRVNTLNRRLGAAVGGDNVGDMPRVLRLPGFKNVKYEHQPRAWLLDHHPERRYSLDQLDAALPQLPESQPATPPSREYVGDFKPHWGTPLDEADQVKLTIFLNGLGLRLHPDGRFTGACPFDHDGIFCDCDSAFYCSPVTGTWTCFCSDHVGKTSGTINALQTVGFKNSPTYRNGDELSWGEIAAMVARNPIEQYHPGRGEWQRPRPLRKMVNFTGARPWTRRTK